MAWGTKYPDGSSETHEEPLSLEMMDVLWNEGAEALAKLNKKKTADQVIKNLTDSTKYKFSVQASASGKISITEKIRRGFSMRHLRGK